MDKYKGIKIDKDSPEHLYIQLFKSMRTLIFNGILSPHEKLPPIRKMAEYIEVNNVTVVNAYKLLEEELLVYKKVGSGTFVAPVSEDGTEMDSVVPVSHLKYDFTISSPTADLFPVDDFKRVLNEVLERDKGFAFGYQESKGFLPLRHSLCGYLEKHGVETLPEDIQIISGAQQGIDLVSKAVLDYGDTVVVESPTYTGAIANFKLKGANIVEIPLLSDGIDLEAFEAVIKKQKPKLVYLMPNAQNPTGISYSEEKKAQLIAWSKQYNFWILEDDYASDLNYYQLTPRALKAYEHNDRIIHIKSFSKVLMPGLRLGFMIVPKPLADAIAIAKHSADISTSGLIQRAFDLYIRKGYWDNQMKLMNQIFTERYEAMKTALEKYTPSEVSYILPSGGYNFWLTLPTGSNADELAWRLQDEGIGIIPGSVFFHTQIKSASFRLSIAGLEADEIEKGIQMMMHYVREWLDKKRVDTRDFAKPVL